MTWVTHSSTDNAVIAEIEKQRPRGAAVIAASLLESRLEATLKSRLGPSLDKAISGRLFGGSGPLGSFSAKIDLGRLMDAYPNSIHAMLHKIRDIRNDFAHNMEPLNFDTPTIRARCKNLLPLLLYVVGDGNKHLTDLEKALGYPQKRQWYGTFAIRHQISAPRTIYMASIKRLLLHLSMVQDVFIAAQFSLPPLPDRHVPQPTPQVPRASKARQLRKQHRREASRA